MGDANQHQNNQQQPNQHAQPQPHQPKPSWPPVAPEQQHVNHALLGRLTNQPLYGTLAKQQTISDYISNKRVKVAHQYRTEAVGLPQIIAQSALAQSVNKHVSSPDQALSSGDTTASALFVGIVFWINGLTKPPMHELRAIAYQNGGEVENVLIPRVTHIVANNLPSTKIAEFKGTQRHKRVIVQPDWIVACVSAQRLLPAVTFALPELRDMNSQAFSRWIRTPSSTSAGYSPLHSDVPESNHLSVPSPFVARDAASPATHSTTSPVESPAVESASITVSQDIALSHPKPMSFRTMLFKKPTPVVVQPDPVSATTLFPQPARDLRGNLIAPALRSDARLTGFNQHVISGVLPSTSTGPCPTLLPQHHTNSHHLPSRTDLESNSEHNDAHLNRLIDTNSTQDLTTIASDDSSTDLISPAALQIPSDVMALSAQSPVNEVAFAAVPSLPPNVAPPSRLLPSSMTGTASVSRQSARSTLNDPHFVSTFFAASRLSFIGSWKRLFQHIIPDLLKITPKYSSSAYPRLSEGPRWILHADLDCFFASIAVRDNPSLKGKPVAVSHSVNQQQDDQSSTAAISSCNYEARAFGLKAEMLIGHACSLCPNLVVVPYEFEKYATASESVYRELFSVTHMIQAVSLDEALIELPSSLDQREVMQICQQIRANVNTNIGVQISIGIGSSRLIARLATRKAKPDGVAYIDNDPTVLIPLMARMNVSDLPGVGRKLNAKLRDELNVSTCGDLQAIPRDRLQSLFGDKTGITLYSTCRGLDDRPLEYVGTDTGSNQQTLAVNVNYGIRFHNVVQVRAFLTDLCKELHTRLITTISLACQSVTLRLMVRKPDAPLEPMKYLGHGKCDARSKSKLIDGGSIAEGGQLSESDARKLFKTTWDLFDKLRVEFSIEISDIRGVALMAGKLKKRASVADHVSALAAFGFAPVSAMLLSDDESDDDIAEIKDMRVELGNRLAHADSEGRPETVDEMFRVSASHADLAVAAPNTIDIPLHLGQPGASSSDRSTATVAVPVDDLLKLLASHGLTLQRTVTPALSPAPVAAPTVDGNKSIDETVAEVDAQKERELIDLLPPFDFLDRSVIASLPVDVKQELAAVYKKKRAMQNIPPRSRLRISAVRTDPMPSIVESDLELPRLPGAHRQDRSGPSVSTSADLSMSQVDPTVLAELPLHIRSEIEHALRRSRPPSLMPPPAALPKRRTRITKSAVNSRPSKSATANAQPIVARSVPQPVYEIVSPQARLTVDRPPVPDGYTDLTSATPVRTKVTQSVSRTTISLLTPVSQKQDSFLSQPPVIVTQTDTPAATTTFLTRADIEPEMSTWLRALQTAARHEHTDNDALPCCCDHVSGDECVCSSFCLCPCSSNAATIVTMCRTQLQLRNAELVGHVVTALRRVAVLKDHSLLSQRRCVCFHCNCWSLIACINNDVKERYRAQLYIAR